MLKVKTDLKALADVLPSDATYADAMYELYVRMKVAQGKQDLRSRRVTSHDDVKKRFVG